MWKQNGNQRRTSRLPKLTRGRANIELVFLPSQQVQVSVIHWCDTPIMIETVMTLLDSIRASPHVMLSPFDPEALAKRRRGGPIPTPDEDKVRIIRDWLGVQGHTKEEVFAHEQGISSATLRRWKRQLELQGKL